MYFDEKNEDGETVRYPIGGTGSNTDDYIAKSDILSIISYDNYAEGNKPVNTQAVIDYSQRELANYLTRTNLAQIIGDGEISAAQILYDINPENKMTIKEKIEYIEGTIGDIGSLFDELHSYAQTLIGGEA